MVTPRIWSRFEPWRWMTWWPSLLDVYFSYFYTCAVIIKVSLKSKLNFITNFKSASRNHFIQFAAADYMA